MGSDNVYTKKLWEYYEPYFKEEKFFGLVNSYFLDTVNDKAILVKSYAYDHDGKPFAFGAGRVIKRNICEAIPEMWRKEWNVSMDGCSRYNILEHGFKETIIDTGEDPVMLNMISWYNLNPFSAAEERRDKYVDADWIKKEFNILDTDDPNVALISLDNFHRAVLKKDSVNKKAAFDEVNYIYRETFGTLRFKNYNSYRVATTRKFKNNA